MSYNQNKMRKYERKIDTQKMNPQKHRFIL